VDVQEYETGDAEACRKHFSIDPQAPLIGHVGRLAEEKNISLLGRACGRVMQEEPEARFLVVGDGDSREQLRTILDEMKVIDRAVFAGTLKGQDLVDAYHAMDVFAFASQTETQGMVLAEACAAGCPVAALDAPGAREVVRDRENGRLVGPCDSQALADGILWILRADEAAREQLSGCARETSRAFSGDRCTEKLLDAYRHCLETTPKKKDIENDSWKAIVNRLQEEWKLWSNRMQSAFSALEGKSDTDKRRDPGRPG
jgi:glycosyltransferase involved in cell wall biosynthesis